MWRRQRERGGTLRTKAMQAAWYLVQTATQSKLADLLVSSPQTEGGLQVATKGKGAESQRADVLWLHPTAEATCPTAACCQAQLSNSPGGVAAGLLVLAAVPPVGCMPEDRHAAVR